MAITESLLPEFEHETATTRLPLDRVPAEHAGWKPHPKSMSLGELACGLAAIPVSVQPGFMRGRSTRPHRMASRTGHLGSPPGERPTSGSTGTSPRRGMQSPARTMRALWSLGRFDHMIHHRGQLTVSLRLKDVPLPGIYGSEVEA
jgi:hypothetical protein